MRREYRERFPPPPISKETDSWRSRHASRHVRDARAVMHVGIAHLRWRGKRSRHSRRMRTRNFTYLARGPCQTRLNVALLAVENVIYHRRCDWCNTRAQLSRPNPGWRLVAKPIFSAPFHSFLYVYVVELWKHGIPIGCHVQIWQRSSQLSSGDTWKINSTKQHYWC